MNNRICLSKKIIFLSLITISIIAIYFFVQTYSLNTNLHTQSRATESACNLLDKKCICENNTNKSNCRAYKTLQGIQYAIFNCNEGILPKKIKSCSRPTPAPTKRILKGLSKVTPTPSLVIDIQNEEGYESGSDVSVGKIDSFYMKTPLIEKHSSVSMGDDINIYSFNIKSSKEGRSFLNFRVLPNSITDVNWKQNVVDDIYIKFTRQSNRADVRYYTGHINQIDISDPILNPFLSKIIMSNIKYADIFKYVRFYKVNIDDGPEFPAYLVNDARLSIQDNTIKYSYLAIQHQIEFNLFYHTGVANDSRSLYKDSKNEYAIDFITNTGPLLYMQSCYEKKLTTLGGSINNAEPPDFEIMPMQYVLKYDDYKIIDEYIYMIYRGIDKIPLSKFFENDRDNCLLQMPTN